MNESNQESSFSNYLKILANMCYELITIQIQYSENQYPEN